MTEEETQTYKIKVKLEYVYYIDEATSLEHAVEQAKEAFAEECGIDFVVDNAEAEEVEN